MFFELLSDKLCVTLTPYLVFLAGLDIFWIKKYKNVTYFM